MYFFGCCAWVVVVLVQFAEREVVVFVRACCAWVVVVLVQVAERVVVVVFVRGKIPAVRRATPAWTASPPRNQESGTCPDKRTFINLVEVLRRGIVVDLYYDRGLQSVQS